MAEDTAWANHRMHMPPFCDLLTHMNNLSHTHARTHIYLARVLIVVIFLIITIPLASLSDTLEFRIFPRISNYWKIYSLYYIHVLLHINSFIFAAFSPSFFFVIFYVHKKDISRIIHLYKHRWRGKRPINQIFE